MTAIAIFSWGLALALGSVSAWAQKDASDMYQQARKLYETQKAEAALEFLAKTETKGWSGAQVALRSLMMATWAQELQRWDDSRKYLQETLELDSSKAAYVHYLLGQSFRRTGQAEKTKFHYQKALALKPSSQLKQEMRFELGELALAEKNYRAAFDHFAYLERRWRSTYRHPEVLVRLMRVEAALKRKWRVCHWARRVFSRYPAHREVVHWGIDLPAAQLDGTELGCPATGEDQKSRIRRLQWAGESEKARKEIEILKSRAKGPVVYEVDLLLAQYLTNEGYVEEALKVLLKHYEKQNRSFRYLMLLGQAAARGGEYQTAVGAFTRAHELSPRSRAGRQALFQAAFLSYQFQDYDGAARKFEEFRRLHPRSGLSRDAEWHLAWIRYLKGDYEGAIRSFSEGLAAPARRRASARHPTDRLRYWLAMSYLRQEKYDKARSLFLDLMGDRLIGYYAVAAHNRYNSLPGVTPIRSLASFEREMANLNQNLEKVDGPGIVLPDGGDGATAEENESEDALTIGAAEEAAPPDGEETETKVSGETAGTEAEEPATDDDDEKVTATAISDPRLAQRFQQATDLINAGLFDWAKWELHEIERRTRNPEYLKTLMKSFERIQSYNRSSYIGEVHFSAQRREQGIQGARYLWEYAYPRAYRETVERHAGQFGVPAEFVWSIMRAESAFKTDVVSPVGARGLMQLMPFTARQVARMLQVADFREEQLNDPEVNIRMGARYLNRLLKKFDQVIPLAAAGYNAGPHRVESWLSTFGSKEMDEFIEHIPFVETRNYVKKVVRHFAIYKDLYARDQKPLMWMAQPIAAKIPDKPSTRETWD